MLRSSRASLTPSREERASDRRPLLADRRGRCGSKSSLRLLGGGCEFMNAGRVQEDIVGSFVIEVKLLAGLLLCL